MNCLRNVAFSAAGRVMLSSGAENTKRRLTAPVISGFPIFTALCREWTGIQHPFVGNTVWLFSCSFSATRPLCALWSREHGHPTVTYYALKKRQEKGSHAMFSVPLLSRTLQPHKGGAK